MTDRDALDRLAQRIIDEVLAKEVADRQAELREALRQVSGARRGLAGAERDLRAWRRRREFGHRTGMRALTAARFADFVPSAIPPGTHMAAVAGYLRDHQPTWEAPGPRPRDAALSAARAVGAGVGRIARRVRRRDPSRG